jgi:hypothetical protein
MYAAAQVFFLYNSDLFFVALKKNRHQPYFDCRDYQLSPAACKYLFAYCFSWTMAGTKDQWVPSWNSTGWDSPTKSVRGRMLSLHLAPGPSGGLVVAHLLMYHDVNATSIVGRGGTTTAVRGVCVVVSTFERKQVSGSSDMEE